MDTITHMIAQRMCPRTIMHRLNALHKSEANEALFVGGIRELLTRALGQNDAVCISILEKYHNRLPVEILQQTLAKAIKDTHYGVVDVLLARGVGLDDDITPDGSHIYGIKSLMRDILQRDTAEALMIFLKHNKSWMVGKYRISLLSYVIYHDAPKCLEYVMCHSDVWQHINTDEGNGITPLLLAAYRKPILIPRLLDLGADVNVTFGCPADDRRFNILHVIFALNCLTRSTDYDYFDMIRACVEAGLDRGKMRIFGRASPLVQDLFSMITSSLGGHQDRWVEIKCRTCVKLISPSRVRDMSEMIQFMARDIHYCIVHMPHAISRTPDVQGVNTQFVQRVAIEIGVALSDKYMRPELQWQVVPTLECILCVIQWNISRLAQLGCATFIADPRAEILRFLEQNCQGQKYEFYLQQSVTFSSMIKQATLTIHEILSNLAMFSGPLTQADTSNISKLIAVDHDTYGPILTGHLLQIGTSKSLELLKQILCEQNSVEASYFLRELSEQVRGSLRLFCKKTILQCLRPSRRRDTEVLPLPRAIKDYLLSPTLT